MKILAVCALALYSVVLCDAVSVREKFRKHHSQHRQRLSPHRTSLSRQDTQELPASPFVQETVDNGEYQGEYVSDYSGSYGGDYVSTAPFDYHAVPSESQSASSDFQATPEVEPPAAEQQPAEQQPAEQQPAEQQSSDSQESTSAVAPSPSSPEEHVVQPPAAQHPVQTFTERINEFVVATHHVRHSKAVPAVTVTRHISVAELLKTNMPTVPPLDGAFYLPKIRGSGPGGEPTKDETENQSNDFLTGRIMVKQTQLASQEQWLADAHATLNKLNDDVNRVTASRDELLMEIQGLKKEKVAVKVDRERTVLEDQLKDATRALEALESKTDSLQGTARILATTKSKLAKEAAELKARQQHQQ